MRNPAETAAEQPSGEEQRPESISENERLLAPQRYKVQFTASQEYVDLLKQAQDLLAPAVPRKNLEQVHLRALELLVAELKKRKYAVTERSLSAVASSRARPDPRRRGLSRNRRPRTAASVSPVRNGHHRRSHPQPSARLCRASAVDPGSERRARAQDRHPVEAQASPRIAPFRRPCAVRSPSATSTGALMWTIGDTGVGKLAVSSFITNTLTRSADRQRSQILLCGAVPITPSPLSRIMAVSS